MKRSEMIFSTVQVFIDAAMIICGALFAYRLRHTTEVQELIRKEGLFGYSLDQYVEVVMIFLPVILLLYMLEGLYSTRVTRKYGEEIFAVIKGTSIALVLLTIGFFLQREWFSSRFIIVAAWFLIILFVTAGRMMLRLLQRYLLVTRGIGKHRVCVIGTDDKVEHICRVIGERPQLGYVIVRHLEQINLGTLKKIHERSPIDEVIVHEAVMPEDLLAKLHDFCEINGIAYKFLPTSRQITRFHVEIFDGEPLMEIAHTPLDGWGKIIKRVFDLCASVLLIVVTAPIVALAAILIKLEDPAGPIVFRNERIGADGKKFFVYKLRYLQWRYCTTPANPGYEEALAYEKELIETQSERVGPIYKITNDPRKMRIGALLERYSIDEFLQFYNVLRGDMSIVGPRPHQEREVEKYREYHRRLLTVNPGITGMAQVSGRSDLDFEDEYRLDVYYIENWSLLLDVIIILKTPFAVLRRRNN